MLYSSKISYLKKGLNKKSGRNFRGKITVYHKGGGNKINYRTACKLNKHGDNIQPQHTLFPNWNLYVVPCLVLIVSS